MNLVMQRENKLQQQIHIIKNEISSQFQNNLISIILYGSYGRGEGAFYYDDSGCIRTYNDFDIIVVLDYLVDIKKVHKIGHLLSEKLDVKWVDISQKTILKLKTLELNIFNYDLKYGSRVIYGDENVINFIPSFNAKNIHLKEVETLYFTRMWAFLGCLPYDGFDRKLNSEETRFFNYQMAKAILAVVDIILIQKKQYCTSYIARVDRIFKISKNDVQLIKWSKWAIEEKMSPTNDVISPSELKEMYKEVLSLFLFKMYPALSLYYKININGAFDVKKGVFRSISELIIFFKVLLKTRKFDYFKKIKLKLVQSFLVESFLKNKTEKECLLKESKKILRKLDKSLKVRSLDWNEMRLIVSKLRAE